MKYCRYKREELEMIDNQGRCVITDHGAFCLFNVYGPAVTNELSERFAFKMRFYQVNKSRQAVHMQTCQAPGLCTYLFTALGEA